MSRNRLGRIAGALVPALALAGCSTGSGGVPEGWVAASAPRLELHVPEGWDDAGVLDENWDRHWVDEQDGEPVRQLAVGTDVIQGTPSAETLGSGLLETLRFSQGERFELLEKLPDPPERGGDYLRFRYTLEEGEGKRPVEGVIWAVGAADAQPVAVRLTGWDLDDDLIEKIDAGLRFRPGT